MCRVLIYLSFLVLVCTACAWAAYQYAWHSYWAVHMIGEDVYKPIEDHILYIGIMSPPGNFKERLSARKEWVQDARRYYGDGKIKIEFLIGEVPIQGNKLRGHGDLLASESEKKLEAELQDEENMNGDISRSPANEDNNEFQTDKTLWLLRNAVSWKARFVMQTTDNQKIDVKAVVQALEQNTPVAPPVYFGMDYDPDPATDADGRKTWFFRRECFGMSGELAYSIIKTHLPHTIGFSAYGSSNTAENVAKWVEYEDDLRIQANVSPVMHLRIPRITQKMGRPMPKISSPRSSASPCAPTSPCAPA